MDSTLNQTLSIQNEWHRKARKWRRENPEYGMSGKKWRGLNRRKEQIPILNYSLIPLKICCKVCSIEMDLIRNSYRISKDEEHTVVRTTSPNAALIDI